MRSSLKKAYRYQFNGMEADNEVKGAGNSYNFGARMYDPRVGRWLSRDARERDYVPISPYAFGLNNPIYFIDPDGNTIYDSKGNEVIINENSDGTISVSNTEDKALVNLIQDTWSDSKIGQSAIKKLNNKDIKVKITLIEKRVVWKSPDGGFGEVGGLSGEGNPPYTDEIEIVATDIDDVTIPISTEDYSDFVIMDEYGREYSEKKKEKNKSEIIKSVEERKGKSQHKNENESIKNLNKEELSNYKEASAIDHKNKKLRNINTLIYEAENVSNNYGVKGEEEGKKAVGNAHKERESKK
jgi:RHS repeat-associated protein